MDFYDFHDHGQLNRLESKIFLARIAFSINNEIAKGARI
jgi:hypothetical protein